MAAPPMLPSRDDMHVVYTQMMEEKSQVARLQQQHSKQLLEQHQVAPPLPPGFYLPETYALSMGI